MMVRWAVMWHAEDWRPTHKGYTFCGRKIPPMSTRTTDDLVARFEICATCRPFVKGVR